MGGAGPSEPLRVPPRRAAALPQRHVLATPRRSPAPALPGDHRALARRPALPDHHRRAGQGADRGEPHRGAAELLRPLDARGGRGDGRAPAPSAAAASNHGDPTRAGAADGGGGRARRTCRGLRPPTRSGRAAGTDTYCWYGSGARTDLDPARAGRGSARRHRAPDRRPAPAPHHGQPGVPAGPGDRQGRALARRPKRHHRAGAPGGTPAVAGEAGQGAGGGEEAARPDPAAAGALPAARARPDGTSSTSAGGATRGHPCHRPPRRLGAGCRPLLVAARLWRLLRVHAAPRARPDHSLG
jgi:hypothetical protein